SRRGLDMPPAVLGKAALDVCAREPELLHRVLVFRTALARVRTHVLADLASRSVRHRQSDVAVDPLDDAHRVLDRVAEVDVDEFPGRQRIPDGKTAIEVVL